MMHAVSLLGATLLPAAGTATPPPALPRDLPAALTFRALTLDEAERAALARSPDVAAAQARVDAAAAAVGAARAAAAPALTGGYVEAPQGGSNGGTIAQRLTTVGLQSNVADLVASSPATAQAMAAERGARADESGVELNERVKTIGLYYDALKASAIDAARASAVDLASRQRDAAQLRVRAGDAPRLDVIRAQVAVARARAAAETAHAANENAQEALRVETGADVAALAVVPGVFAEPPRAFVATADDAAAAALRMRPEVRSASDATAAARAAERAARAAFLPALTVGAGYSAGVDSGVSVHGPTVTVNAALPLSNGSARKAAQQAAAVRESEAKEASLRRQIALDASASFRNDAAARRATAAADEALRESAQELAATELGYRDGASSSLDVSNARETYTQALVDDFSARYDEAKAAATFALEVGSR